MQNICNEWKDWKKIKNNIEIPKTLTICSKYFEKIQNLMQKIIM